MYMCVHALRAIASIHMHTYIVCVCVCVCVHTHWINGKSDYLTGAAIIAGPKRGFGETWHESTESESHVWVEVYYKDGKLLALRFFYLTITCVKNFTDKSISKIYSILTNVHCLLQSKFNAVVFLHLGPIMKII